MSSSLARSACVAGLFIVLGNWSGVRADPLADPDIEPHAVATEVAAVRPARVTSKDASGR